MGSSNEKSIYGLTKNPINKLYVPRLLASAAARANFCQLALGTDTGDQLDNLRHFVE